MWSFHDVEIWQADLFNLENYAIITNWIAIHARYLFTYKTKLHAERIFKLTKFILLRV